MADDKWGAGDRAKWSDWGTVRVGSRDLPLIWGEHKHSYSDNKMYVIRNPDSEPIPFDGHRVLLDVRLISQNYLKESEISGDEYRKGGTGEIIADGEVVYEFFFRDIQWALLHAHSLIGKLWDHPSHWLVKKDREALIGRKVYYERSPAKITRLITEQGCLILEPDGVKGFDPPVYDPDYDEFRDNIKTEVLDRKIWWFRE